MRKCLFLIITCLSACGGSVMAQSADDLLAQGRRAYLDYQFDEAARLYSQAKAKAKKSDEFFADKYDVYHSQLNRAKSFLERVENIEIIDSIDVNRAEFFRAYRLPKSAGILGGTEALPRRLRDTTKTDYVFTSERGNYKIWSQPSDSTDYNVLVESTLLTDGNWSDPQPLDEDLVEEGDAVFPFMMADGVTLYYADNGENSIGGYDIMVATRDASDGSFMQPSNLGFPYNSPYDDYLLAIDELNGIGWWATDRNQLDDSITIYVFIPRELRNNYPADREDIVELARISDIASTQPEDADYEKLYEIIDSTNPGGIEKEREFTLHCSGGKTFTRYDELPDAKSRAAMKAYLSADKELARSQQSLNDMRRQYNQSPTATLANAIKKSETEIEASRKEVKRLLSEVYKTLK